MSHFFNVLFGTAFGALAGFVVGFVAFPAVKTILEDYKDVKLSEAQINEAMNLANNLHK